MDDTRYLQIDDDTAIPMDEAAELKKIFTGALGHYVKSGMTPKEWSAKYFREQFPGRSDEEIAEWAGEIDTTLSEIEAKRESLAAARKNGIGADDWFAKDVQSAAAQMGGKEAAAYFSGLDLGVKNMNQTWKDAVLKKYGGVSANPNLDGFIAEAHHANSFNASAAAQGSPYRAEVLKPGGSGYSKNSVDIVIKDTATGKTVRRYQSKYGKTAEHTAQAFENGDYRGQRKLVPEGQGVANSSDHIEMDGIKSEPLSKEAAKRKQEETQSSRRPPAENYNAYDAKAMLKNIAQDVAMAGVIGAGVSAAFDIGAKLARGEDAELEDVAAAAVKGGADAAVKTVAASAVKAAIEKDAIKAAIPLKGAPLGQFIAAIDIGISNVKTIYKMGDGQITLKEGLYEIEANTVAGVAGYVSAGKGAAIGMGIGSALGPVGAAVGGFVGGVVGGLAGSAVVRAVTKGVQKVRGTVWEAVKAAGRGIGKLTEAAGNFLDNMSGFFSGLFA